MCGQVIVHEVPVSLDDTHLLTVTMTLMRARRGFPAGPGVHDSLPRRRYGWEVGSGCVYPDRQPNKDYPMTDQFGRALFEAKLGSPCAAQQQQTAFGRRQLTGPVLTRTT